MATLTWPVQIGEPPFAKTATVSLFDDGVWACNCGQVGLPLESARGRNCEHIGLIKVAEAKKRAAQKKLQQELEAAAAVIKLRETKKQLEDALKAELAAEPPVVIQSRRKIHLED